MEMFHRKILSMKNWRIKNTGLPGEVPGMNRWIRIGKKEGSRS
jgi:hypothetical protein